MPAIAAPLSDQDRAFVRAALDNGGRFTDAHRIAYPEWDGKPERRKDAAIRLASKRNVKAALDAAKGVQAVAVSKVMDRYGITQERLAQAMAWLAFSDYTQVMDVSVDDAGKVTARPKPMDQIPEEARFAICGLRCKPDGTLIEYVLPDRRACTMDLGRLLGLIQDKPIESKQMVLLKIER